MQPLVSVIIPVFNRERHIARCLESVVNQSLNSYEIIVIDDGSTDCTGDIVFAYQARYPEIMNVVASEKNRGVGVSRQIGTDIARGKYLQYLDSDDLLRPKKLEKQVNYLESDCAVDVVYGKAFSMRNDVLNDKEIWRGTGESQKYLLPRLLKEHWWPTCAPLYRNEIVYRAGMWKDMRYGGDWEFEARVAGLNARLGYIADPVCDVAPGTPGSLTSQMSSPAVQKRLIADRVKLISSLQEAATQCGTDRKAPEYRHFARWAFLLCRQAAKHDLYEEALIAINIAKTAGFDDVKLFNMLLRVFGWRTFRRIALVVRKV